MARLSQAWRRMARAKEAENFQVTCWHRTHRDDSSRRASFAHFARSHTPSTTNLGQFACRVGWVPVPGRKVKRPRPLGREWRGWETSSQPNACFYLAARSGRNMNLPHLCGFLVSTASALSRSHRVAAHPYSCLMGPLFYMYSRLACWRFVVSYLSSLAVYLLS